MQIKNILKNKNVLFITTKNIDYIRNTQEINLIKKFSKNYSLIYSRKKTYLGRIIEIYLKLLFMTVRHFDLVFIGFSPQLILPFWYWKIKDKKIVIDFFISLYDTLVDDRKIIKQDSLFSKIIHFIDSHTIKKSSHIIVDTKADSRYFSSEFNYNIDKNEVLYLEADSSIYYPKQVKKPDIYRDKFIVLYFGSVLPLQGVDIVLEAYNTLKSQDDILCFFIGRLNKNLKKIESPNIQFIDWLPQNELANYIAMADLCLSGHFAKEIGKAKRTIPGKAYIYNAMEKKIILGDNEANREYFVESERIRFVKHGSSADLANAIIEIKNNFNKK